jgi:hypothetical protein
VSTLGRQEGPIEEIGAYSESTGVAYLSWAELVEAEANGYVMVAIITKGNISWPWIIGPFATQREAKLNQAKQRRKWNKGKQDYPELTASFFVRPTWKAEHS